MFTSFVKSQNIILAPQNNDVITVSSVLSTIPLLLTLDNIDSTHYQVISDDYIYEYWSIEDPYTLNIPIRNNVKVNITTYGNMIKKETINLTFKRFDLVSK